MPFIMLFKRIFLVFQMKNPRRWVSYLLLCSQVQIADAWPGLGVQFLYLEMTCMCNWGPKNGGLWSGPLLKMRTFQSNVILMEFRGLWAKTYKETYTVELQWLVNLASLNSFFSPLEKNSMAAYLGKFRVIFSFILKMVYCVYSLELSRWGDSNDNTQHTFMLKKINNITLLCLLI